MVVKGVPNSHKAATDQHWISSMSFCKILVYVALLTAILFPTVQAAAAASDHCILVDSDADLDDYRAIATLASTEEIRAVIVTEGISRGPQGALAMQEFLRRTGLKIPIIVGARPDPSRKYEEKPGFKDWRATAESLNGTLEVREISPPSDGDVTVAVRAYVNDCTKITLLMIGPWTSFTRYSADLLPKIDRIVAQGRPVPDEVGGEPDGFNCTYDVASCYAAFDLLAGHQLRAGRRLRTSWVDIPNTVEVCGLAEPGVDMFGEKQYYFVPREDWLPKLSAAGGRAKVIAEILQNNVSTWKKTSLWDDLTALYIIRPEIFGWKGGHLEPCIPSQSVRDILRDLMAKN
jgi:hypothetical protein